MQHGRDLLLLDRVFGRARMEPLAEYRRIVESLGLRVTKLNDLSRETRPTFAAWRRNADAFRTEVEALLGREALDEFIASTHVLEAFWDRDKLGYGILAALKPRS